MFPIIAQWEASCESQTQFCQSRDIKPAVFNYWRKKYLDDQQAVRPSEFIELIASVEEKIEICYPNGVRINLPSSSTLATLEALIQLR